MKQEIIEIGIVEMDLGTLEITRSRSYFVRPRPWEISAKCTQLTGITREDVRKAPAFPEVILALAEEFAPANGLCCTWGDDAALIQETAITLARAQLPGGHLSLLQRFQRVHSTRAGESQ
jgi:inhibitor of KinA sporulation pathway (predicted exonuclease)